VTKDPRGDTLGRGTRVTLFLKDDAAEFVDQEKLKNLVKKYSEFIGYPIRLYLSKDIKEQVPVEEEEKPKDDGEEGDTEITDEEEKVQKDDDEPKEPKTKTVNKTVWEWETINDIKAIWMREKSEITDREYNDFYKTISKDH